MEVHNANDVFISDRFDGVSMWLSESGRDTYTDKTIAIGSRTRTRHDTVNGNWIGDGGRFGS